jgi:hypothetical protein
METLVSINDNERKRGGVFQAGDGLADGNAGNPGNGDDIAYLGHLGIRALEPVEREQLGDLGLGQ